MEKQPKPKSQRLRGLRALHVSEDWSGMLRFHGLLDPESGLIVRHALEALTDPANLDPADLRTPAQALGRRPRRDQPPLPPRRVERLPAPFAGDDHRPLGHPPRQATGVVDTEVGRIPAETARRLTCDATVSRVLLDPPSRCPSRWDGPPVSSPTAYAGSSNCETPTAPTPDARSRPGGAKPTTSDTGPKEAPPTPPTCNCSAADTTPTPTRTIGTPNASTRPGQPGASPPPPQPDSPRTPLPERQSRAVAP